MEVISPRRKADHPTKGIDTMTPETTTSVKPAGSIWARTLLRGGRRKLPKDLVERLEQDLKEHPLRQLPRSKAAAFCGVSVWQMRQLEKSGVLLPYYKTRGSTFYLYGELLSWVAGRDARLTTASDEPHDEVTTLSG
jgi:hypothetical protein